MCLNQLHLNVKEEMGILTFFNYSSKELELMAQLKIGWVGGVGGGGR